MRLVLLLVLLASQAGEARRCLVRSDAAGVQQSVDATLRTLSKTIINSIVAGKERPLQALLHARLQKQGVNLGEFFSRLQLLYRRPLSVQVARLWELETKSKVEELYCERDALYLKPTYGFARQYYLWLSVIGKREMGRVLLVLVQKDKRWVITALHTQQWTHLGYDFNNWLKQAVASKKQPMLAYIKYDIAAKLLQENPFMRFPQTAVILAKQQQLLTTNKWEETIKQAVGSLVLVHSLETLLTVEGIGVLLRLRLNKQKSGKETQRLCTQILERLQTRAWFQGVAGIKCDFLLKGEEALQAGVLGGIYLQARKPISSSQ